MSHPVNYVTLEKLSELTGLTVNAIRAYMKKGKLRQKIHWIKAPNGRIMINLVAYEKWIESGN